MQLWNGLPERERAMNVSPLLRLPSLLKSERKLAALVLCPERFRTCVASPELTLRSPFVSRTRHQAHSPSEPRARCLN